MKSILLIGIGRFGSHIAMKFNELGQQVMAVDRVEEKIENILPYVSSGQIGDSTDREFLESLGVRNFDVCIVTVSDDFQSSLETTYNLKELGAKKIVARADRDVQEKFLIMAGADEIVYPEKQLGNWTAVRYSSNHVFDYIELEEGFAIFELEVPDAWVGKTLIELDVRKKYQVNIVALKKQDGMTVNLLSEVAFSKGDKVMVVGKEKDIHKNFRI